jgi:hypothetical protein
MIARAGSGWQYILADLSLILFMVTAAALASADDPHPVLPPPPAGRPLSPEGAPLALYRAAPGAPPLAEWLREQSADPRQQLTIVAQYGAGDQAAALGRAEALAREAGAAGARARIVVEPGEGGATAALAFDTPARTVASPLARNLQETGRTR